MTTQTIKTRFLILSDTHGTHLPENGKPKQSVDVVIHCGNLKKESGLEEFQAVAYARPLIHCFGHVHDNWGARLVRWLDKIPNPPSHFTGFGIKESVMIETLKTLKAGRFDTVEVIMEKYGRVKRYEADGCCETRHSKGGKYPLERGAQTLFVNAAVQGPRAPATVACYKGWR